MKWSWKIGEYKGIPVYIHATFLIIIAWVALSHWIQGHNLSNTLIGIGFVLALFACVVLHEFGHALSLDHIDDPASIMYPLTSEVVIPSSKDRALLNDYCGEIVLSKIVRNYLEKLSNLVNQ